MQIRPAHASDALRLSGIAWQAKTWWGYTAQQMAPWRDELTITAASIAAHPTFVLEHDGAVNAFCQLLVDGSVAELSHLWVDPDCMRRGAGRALFAHAAAHARAAGCTRMVIDADPGAREFYVACGAILTHERPAPIDGAPGRTRPQLACPL